MLKSIAVGDILYGYFRQDNRPRVLIIKKITVPEYWSTCRYYYYWIFLHGNKFLDADNNSYFTTLESFNKIGKNYKLDRTASVLFGDKYLDYNRINEALDKYLDKYVESLYLC